MVEQRRLSQGHGNVKDEPQGEIKKEQNPRDPRKKVGADGGKREPQSGPGKQHNLSKGMNL